MKRRHVGLLMIGVFLLSACTKEKGEPVVDTPETSSAAVSSSEMSHTAGTSRMSSAMEETSAITFVNGVDNHVTRGDKYNYYALEGQAEGADRVTAIIEGTAVDFRNTDNQWYFNYPYPGPNVETDITFTTDPEVRYGETGIELEALEPDSYVTITFMPNENPSVQEPAVTVDEGQPHTFRNEDQGIVEVITVTQIELMDAAPELSPLSSQLLRVDVHYVNDGTVTTHMAPNYFSAVDGEGHFLPLRYAHFWLKEVAPGQSFVDTIYYDVTSNGPYSIQFFDGAWRDIDGAGGPNI